MYGNMSILESILESTVSACSSIPKMWIFSENHYLFGLAYLTFFWKSDDYARLLVCWITPPPPLTFRYLLYFSNIWSSIICKLKKTHSCENNLETMQWHTLHAPSVPYIQVCRETGFLFLIPAGQTCGWWWRSESEGLCIRRTRHWNPAGTSDVAPKSRLHCMCYRKTDANLLTLWKNRHSVSLFHC